MHYESIKTLAGKKKLETSSLNLFFKKKRIILPLSKNGIKGTNEFYLLMCYIFCIIIIKASKGVELKIIDCFWNNFFKP